MHQSEQWLLRAVLVDAMVYLFGVLEYATFVDQAQDFQLLVVRPFVWIRKQECKVSDEKHSDAELLVLCSDDEKPMLETCHHDDYMPF